MSRFGKKQICVFPEIQEATQLFFEWLPEYFGVAFRCGTQAPISTTKEDAAIAYPN